ncbi:sensor histidine kinase [Bacillus oleivorans]|nr:HAMP domain-containing sensor histidine kinase [Bacillus oleivorans]
MKIKYFYQQIISHISVIVVAFLVLSLLFTQYMERIVYENKADELITYGENILWEFDRTLFGRENILNQYYHVLNDRDILFAVFDDKSTILYAGDWFITKDRLTEREWNLLKSGKIVEVRQDLKRFEQDVSLVALPYFKNGVFLGGILLISPISGTREMISEMNQFLSIAVLIALAASLLLSSLLSYIHVKRITRIRKATSLVASGDYSVHLPSSTFDEIGELSNDFNQMVKKLNDSMEEIKSLENRRRQFMSDVSHELRTPLTTIRGVIEGLNNDMIPEEKKEKGIQLVSQETNRLIRLVNENLDYDKIRSNQVKLYKVDIQLSEVMEIIKEQLQFQADEKNNQIMVDVQEDLIVHADYDRLIQILINITKNSIQFTEDGTIYLRGKSADKETVIEIEDTGIGIDPQEVEKIWDRFYRADISRKTNPYGEFGLGLSIVKQLVLLHNGSIKVTSEKGKGTKFVIRFPLLNKK